MVNIFKGLILEIKTKSIRYRKISVEILFVDYEQLKFRLDETRWWCDGDKIFYPYLTSFDINLNCS